MQQEIATILPARSEYIETTSEFDQVKARLQRIDANLRVKGSNGPTLRRQTKDNKGGNQNPDDTDNNDGPPTLKRRPNDQGQPDQQP